VLVARGGASQRLYFSTTLFTLLFLQYVNELFAGFLVNPGVRTAILSSWTNIQQRDNQSTVNSQQSTASHAFLPFQSQINPVGLLYSKLTT
jgi:hypothetical protein